MVFGLIYGGLSIPCVSDTVEENENATKECIDEDAVDVKVDVKAMWQSFDVFMIVHLYYFLPKTQIHKLD